MGRATFERVGCFLALVEFQSTPSVGRATMARERQIVPAQDFNPRPPWGGRRFPLQSCFRLKAFQSTPSVGRATRCDRHKCRWQIISIHALRGEGDKRFLGNKIKHTRFQSTPSVGRATVGGRNGNNHRAISIHALRGEGDIKMFDELINELISIHALRGEGDPEVCGLKPC